MAAGAHCSRLLHDAIGDLADANPGRIDRGRTLRRGVGRLLAGQPHKAIVSEDASAGVQAGHAGGFGLVIGVNRRNQAEALRQQGADIVIADLDELLPSGQDSEPCPLPPAGQ